MNTTVNTGRAVNRPFGVPVLVIFLLQPVLALGLVAYHYGPEVLGPTGLVLGALVLPVLLARCARSHGVARLRAELRWLAQAAARYIACCVTWVLVLLLIGMANVSTCRADDGCFRDDPGGYAMLIAIFTLYVTYPALVLLFLLAPHTLLGRSPVRVVFALLTSVGPLLILIAGGAPVLLLIVAQALYAGAFLPVASRPAPAD